MSKDDWKNEKHDKHQDVKKHSGLKNPKPVIVIVIIVLVLSISIFVYQNHINAGMVHKETNNVIANASKIQPSLGNTSQQNLHNVSNVTSQTSKQISANLLSTKPVIDIPVLEQKIHDLINVQRQENSKAVLSFDPELTAIALSHSQDMANRHYFSHYTPEGSDPTARGLSVGYHCHKDLPNGYHVDSLAENIFQNNLYRTFYMTDGVITYYAWNDMDALASTTVQGWMQSPGHRENILTDNYASEGIGVAISTYDDKVDITEDFC